MLVQTFLVFVRVFLRSDNLDCIQSIEINKIKGIKNLKLKLNLLPNLPSIFVAPNGFGKSSITISLSSIKQNKLDVDKENYYNACVNDDSFIKIVVNDKNDEIEYYADVKNSNILDRFSIYTINNKVVASAKKIKFGDFDQVKSQLVIKDIVIKNKIPSKIPIIYSFLEAQSKYGINSKICINLDSVIKQNKFLLNVYKNKKYYENILSSMKMSKNIDNLFEFILTLKGNKNDMYQKIEMNFWNLFIQNNNFNQLAARSFDQKLPRNRTNGETLILIIEQLYFYKKNKCDFAKISNRIFYELEKERIKNFFNCFSDRSKIVQIKETGETLVAKFPNANLLSNGERDLFVFILLLEIAKNKLQKNENILIIDEVFDYLDEINLMIVQKYISNYIKSYKNQNKKIYPIIMTHLDPLLFKNYYFNNQKIYYLLDYDHKIDEDVKKIVYERNKLDKFNLQKQNFISKGYLHYYPEDLDMIDEFSKNGLTDRYNTSTKFVNAVKYELDKYCKNEKSDYFCVICSLRIVIENYIYHKINDIHKEIFIETNETLKKISLVEELGYTFPEVFKFLSILYNDIMHIDKVADPNNVKIKYLTSKLNNLFVRSLIQELYTIISL